MGLFGTLFNIAKTRAAGGMIRRSVGGPLGTGLMLAYFGKKAYDAWQRRDRARRNLYYRSTG